MHICHLTISLMCLKADTQSAQWASQKVRPDQTKQHWQVSFSFFFDENKQLIQQKCMHVYGCETGGDKREKNRIFEFPIK